MQKQKNPDVILVLGSASDAEIVVASGMLDLFKATGLAYQTTIISAHRDDAILTRELSMDSSMSARVIIGAGGMALALPGAVAAKTRDSRVVLGVALPSLERPDARDATEAVIRLPAGTAVGFCGIGKAGLVNAAILACQIVGNYNPGVPEKLHKWRKQQAQNQPPKFNVDLEALVEAQKAEARGHLGSHEPDQF